MRWALLFLISLFLRPSLTWAGPPPAPLGAFQQAQDSVVNARIGLTAAQKDFAAKDKKYTELQGTFSSGHPDIEAAKKERDAAEITMKQRETALNGAQKALDDAQARGAASNGNGSGGSGSGGSKGGSGIGMALIGAAAIGGGLAAVMSASGGGKSNQTNPDADLAKFEADRAKQKAIDDAKKEADQQAQLLSDDERRRAAEDVKLMQQFDLAQQQKASDAQKAEQLAQRQQESADRQAQITATLHGQNAATAVATPTPIPNGGMGTIDLSLLSKP